MPQYCIPSSAGYGGNFTVGETLLVQNWEVDSNEGRGYLQVTDDSCVPVKNLGISTRYNIDEEEFIDWIAGIQDPSIFTVPNYC